MKSKVYFTKEITKESVLKMYQVLGKELKGNVAVKVHSGEAGNQNYLRPEMYEDVIEHLNGTIVECNTAYSGERDTTEKHKKLLDKHNWTKYYNVDLLDSEGPDLVLDILNGKVIKKNYIGKNIKNYDSMLVVSHFKGHPMGGYGGALKQLSIGVASSIGKRYIHCVGKENGSYEDMFKVEQVKFLEAMADSAKSVVDYFNGNIAYVNVMCNMSVDCDCCADAKAPSMKDIGILSSTDPVALDQACIDLVYNSEDEGKSHLIERIESRHGIHTIEAASELNIGSREYELIDIDEITKK